MTPLLSVFFPLHNEARHIKTLVNNASEVLNSLNISYEIILVNDGSTDNTRSIAKEICSQEPKVRLVSNYNNRGYGRALIKGFRAACGEHVFFTDGDNQFDLKELPLFLELAKDYDVVVGYREKRQDNQLRIFFAACWNLLIRLLFGLKIKDIDCAYKLFRRGILDKINVYNLESNGAVISTEIMVKTVAKGGVFIQKPVKHYSRTGGEASGGSLPVILKAFYELFIFFCQFKKGTFN